MRIALLKLKNCLGIKELEFTPGKITLIEGKEGVGKTSILESIQKFFWNKSDRSSFTYSQDGEVAQKAEVYIDLDDGTAMKKYYDKKSKPTTVSVKKGGMSPNAPEMFLKSLVSEAQLNPVSLISMESKELSELVLSLIPIKVTEADLKKWLLEIPPFIDCTKHGLMVCKDIVNVYFTQRTELKRTIKDIEGDIKGVKSDLPKDYDPEQWRNISTSEQYDIIKDANKTNLNIKEAEFRITNSQVKIDAINNESAIKIQQLEKEIQAVKDFAQQRMLEQKETVKAAKEYLAVTSIIDIEPLEKKQEEIDLMKSFIRVADGLKEKEEALNVNEKKAKDLTDKIEYMRTKPQMLLANSEMPIDGITVDDQGNVLVNQRPIKNLSGGERIRFSMDITRATSGDLKIILINGFESLSLEAQDQFIKECTGDGFQYIITKVTDGDLKIKSITDDGSVIDVKSGEIL